MLVDKLEMENRTLRQTIDKLTEKQKNRERYSRAYNLRFGGIKEVKNENCKKIIEDLLAEKFKMATHNTIENAHRVKGQTSSKTPRHIIAKFYSRPKKEEVKMKSRKVLKDTGLFVTED